MADQGEGAERALAPVTYLFGGGSPEAPPAPLSAAFGLDDGSDADFDDDEVGGFDYDEAPDDYACMRYESRDQALRALGRKALSQREVERLLVKDLVPEWLAAEISGDLRREGYLDDTALAQELVGRLQERKGLGRSAIAAELTKRLLSPAAISYALELIDTGDELARAREVARKRAAQLGGLDRDTAVRRLSGYLQRRGYSGSAVRSAVESALPATGTTGRGPRFE